MSIGKRPESVLQTNVTGFVSAQCPCLLRAFWRLNGTAPLTVRPYCSCSGLCAGVSPSQTSCGPESESRPSREKRRSGRAAAVASSDNKPGQRARLCLGAHPAGEQRTLFIWGPWFYFVSGITAWRRGRIIRSRSCVYIGTLTTVEVIWKTCGRAAERVTWFSMVLFLGTDGSDWNCAYSVFKVETVSIKVSCLCPVPQLSSQRSAWSDSA